MRLGLLTTVGIPHNAIQNSHKLGNDMIHFVQACKDCNEIGARIRVLFAQDAGQKDRQSLYRAVSQ